MYNTLGFHYYKDFAEDLSTETKAFMIHERISIEREKFIKQNPTFYVELKNAIEKKNPELNYDDKADLENALQSDSLAYWSGYKNPALQCAYDVTHFLQEEDEYNETIRLLEGKISQNDFPKIKGRMELMDELRKDDDHYELKYQLWRIKHRCK